MAIEDSGYLPPIVINLIGDDSALLRTLADARAAIAAFAQQKPDATLGADDAPAMAKIAEAEAALAAYGREDVSASAGVNIGPALASLAALKAAMSGLGTEATLGSSGSLAGQLIGRAVPYSQSSAINQALATWAGSSGGGGGGGGSGVLGALGGAAAGGGGSSSSGGLKGLILGALLGHGGATTGGGILGALPAFGSLGALAGLGPEHLLMTGVGLAGSATGAALGGGLLGLGAAGVAGVGMGTDLAGIGQAAGDIQQYNQLSSALAQAAAVYGKSSTQYALAAYQYQQWSQDLSKGTVQAVEAANTTATAFHAMFDKVTGDAETTGANIINRIMQVGEKFLPTIGEFASKNMTIIQQQMQPFLTWLQGPGLNIFRQLEQMFTNELPAGVQVASKAFEWLANTILTVQKDEEKWLALHGKIPLLDQINNFLSNPADAQKWSNEIGKLIDQFHTWAAFLDIVAKDVYQIFHADAGTGTSIVQSLTQMLTKLHAWLASTSGQAQLHNVFETHKQEVLALLKLLPPLVKAFGGLELVASPALTSLLAAFVNDALVPFLKVMSGNEVTATLAAILLLEGRLHLLRTTLAALRATIGTGKWLANLFGVGASEGGATALGGGATGGATAVAGGAGVFAGWLAIPALLQRMADQTKGILGNLENDIAFFVNPGVSLFTHLFDTITSGEPIIKGFGTVWSDVKSVVSTAITNIGSTVTQGWNQVRSVTVTVLNSIESTASSVWNAMRGTATSVWNAIWGAASSVWNGIWGTIDSAVRGAQSVASSVWNGMRGTASSVWSSIWSSASSAWNAISSTVVGIVRSMGEGVASNVRGIENWFNGIRGDITSIFSGAGNWLYGVGQAIVDGLVNGISSVAGRVHSAVSSIVNDVKSIPVLGGLIGSASPYFTEVGQAMMQGLANGVLSGQGQTLGALRDVTSQITRTGATMAVVAGGNTTHNSTYYNTTVNAQGGASPHAIASEAAWAIRSMAAAGR